MAALHDYDCFAVDYAKVNRGSAEMLVQKVRKRNYYGGIIYEHAYHGLFGPRETEDVLKTML